MTSDQITQALQELYRKIDGVQQKRQLVFWYDPRGEFGETVDTLALGEVRKLKLDGRPFWVKHQVLVEHPESSFLLYAPFAQPAPEDNWLLDLEKQGQPFAADRAVLLQQQYGLYNRSLSGYLRDHLAFFNNKRRVEHFDAIGIDPDSSEMELRLAMMSALANLKVADPTLLVRSVLMAGLGEENALKAEIEKFFGPTEFWQLAEHYLGFSAERPSLRELFIRLAVTHLAQNLNAPLPEALLPKVIRPGTRAYVFVDSWLRHREHAAAWEALSTGLAGDLGIPSLAAELEPKAYLAVETFEAFDRALIQQAAARLMDESARPSTVRDWVQARKPLHWYGAYEPHYRALEAASRFLGALAGLHLAGDAGELFSAYAERDYQIDQHYRHLIQHSDRVPDDSLKGLIERLERTYGHAYLEPQGEAWSASLKTVSWPFSGPDRQWRFFEHHVRPILGRSDREKAFVIISDAMRFEVMDELRSQLLTELRGEATLTPLVGILPSVTMLGMAALLPGTRLEVTSKGQVLRDGLPTQGSESRQAILDASGFSSLVMSADELLSLPRDEGRQRVQPHRLIYLYHNQIDATGDKAASERGVFGACERAIDTVSQLIKKIANTLNGSNILVVADHGFLYQREPLGEHDKLAQPKGEVIASGRRHVLGRELATASGSHAFELPYLEPAGLTAHVPNGMLRYAVQGAGAQYVHGGASLQEICVPLLAYKHVRSTKGDEGPSRKVGVQLSAATRKITNNHFTLRLVQSEPVSERVTPRQVIVSFVDGSGKPITNAFPLRLDSAASQATDREYIARLTIGTSSIDRDKPYYLVIKDAEDDLELLREPWQVSLAFTDDFGDV